MRSRCGLVSGMVFGPDVFSRARASSLVSPSFDAAPAAASGFADFIRWPAESERLGPRHGLGAHGVDERVLIASRTCRPSQVFRDGFHPSPQVDAADQVSGCGSFRVLLLQTLTRLVTKSSPGGATFEHTPRAWAADSFVGARVGHVDRHHPLVELVIGEEAERQC